MTPFEKLIAALEAKIVNSYEEGVTVEAAERLAGEFLHAQLQVSAELKNADLDSRMRKTGLKAARAKAYMAAATPVDGKKPTEAAIASMVDLNGDVQEEQAGLDASEVTRDELERVYSVFQNAHIHFRTICKGTFGG